MKTLTIRKASQPAIIDLHLTAAHAYFDPVNIHHRSTTAKAHTRPTGSTEVFILQNMTLEKSLLPYHLQIEDDLITLSPPL